MITTDAKPIALVTGSSRGIGAATARLLNHRGYDICIHYRQDRAAAEAMVQDLESQGNRVMSFGADLAHEDQVHDLFRAIDRTLGPISALVNNAAQLKPQCRLVNLSAARINALFQTNVTSYFLCCREAIKRMASSSGGEGGTIVNVSSGAAQTGSPHEYIDYAATKGAIDTLTIGLSKEVASERIRVNGVRPGFIHTQMHADGGEPDRIQNMQHSIPLGRGGNPTEVAEAIAWLLSPAASYCTGTFINCTGGR